MELFSFAIALGSIVTLWCMIARDMAAIDEVPSQKVSKSM
jgi:hypothetical protein